MLWTLVGLLIVFAVVLVFIQAPPRVKQPVYNGRTLEQWLDVGAHSPNARVWGPRNDGKGPTPQQLREAEESVRAIGTNAIPFLLEWTGYRPSYGKRFVRGILEVTIDKTHMPWCVRGPYADLAYRREGLADLGALGFALLNTNALPAREELSNLVRDEKDGGRQSALGKVLFTVTNTPGQ